MYILLVTRGYPSEKYKTNGIFEFDQAKALVEAGHKVVYAAVDVRSIRRTRKWGYESFIRNGVQIEAVNIPVGRFQKNILDQIRKIALSRLYKRIELKYGIPDIIHAHFIDNGYIVSKVFEKMKIPLVITEHFSGMNQKVISPYLFKLGAYTYPRLDQVITVSGYLANNIKQNFGIEAQVVPNVVDTSSFKYEISDKNSTDFCFISTGSLTHNKRMDILVKAFYKAFNKAENIKLYIYGEGPERKRLLELIKKSGLEHIVFLMGLVDRREIAEKMKECDCFVLASELETFGVAYIEAMFMGLPVIATKCGGPEDFITEDNGLLVPVNDIDSLSKALEKIYNNIESYDKKTLVNFAISKFSSPIVANMLTQIYKKYINSK